MTLLRSVALRAQGNDDAAFPFSVPAIRTLPELTVGSEVTFFVGANGSGKSTLLEGIAAGVGLPTIGSGEIKRDPTLARQRVLGKALKLVWSRKTPRGFFLRAEDFFGFTKQLAQSRQELLGRLDEIAVEFGDRSAYARGLASLPVHRSLADMQGRYGTDLDANSHGESFIKLFQTRFVPGGLYLLDEPEAALSPHSQLAFMAMMRDMVIQGSQFIIATHSPLLLAYPGATIYSFDTLPVIRCAFDELEHVALTRDFLGDPERYLRHLGFPSSVGDR